MPLSRAAASRRTCWLPPSRLRGRPVGCTARGRRRRRGSGTTSALVEGVVDVSLSVGSRSVMPVRSARAGVKRPVRKGGHFSARCCRGAARARPRVAYAIRSMPVKVSTHLSNAGGLAHPMEWAVSSRPFDRHQTFGPCPAPNGLASDDELPPMLPPTLPRYSEVAQMPERRKVRRPRMAGPPSAPKRTRTSTRLAWARPSTW